MTPQKCIMQCLLMAVLVMGIISGSTAHADEMINGIAVPPEPDAKENNTTLAGVDSNKNGVRDDVERMIAKKVSSPDTFSVPMTIAAAYQSVVAVGLKSQSESNKFLITIACAAEKTADNLSSTDIQKAILNNSNRMKAFRYNTRNFGGMEIDTDTDCK